MIEWHRTRGHDLIVGWDDNLWAYESYYKGIERYRNLSWSGWTESLPRIHQSSGHRRGLFWDLVADSGCGWMHHQPTAVSMNRDPWKLGRTHVNVGTGLILPLNAVAVYLSTFSCVIQLGFATKQLHYIMLCMKCLDRQGAKIAVFHGERTNGKRFSKYNTQGL